MIVKEFTVGVIIRVVLLLANLVCLAIIFARTELFFSQLILLLLLSFQVYELIRFVTHTNRSLSEFLLAIKHADFSVSFSNRTDAGAAFRHLHQSFDAIISSYNTIAAQKESQFLFFKQIIEQVNVGIIALSEGKQIVLANKAAENLLHIPHLQSWVQLQAIQPAFCSAIDILHGGRRLVELRAGNETRQLSVSLESVLLQGKNYQIITFQDIKTEIEQKEIEAWHKLIRILTHEMMNSVTPVISLTETMLMILQTEEGVQKHISAISEDNISDIRFSLKTIQKRSDGMLHFVNNYRKLARIPVPQLEKVNVQRLIESAAKLMQGEITRKGAELQIQLPDTDTSICADAILIEQVLINLITNSLQAMEGVARPVITIAAYTDEWHTFIEVSDNGKGIDKDKFDKIFIPFYSTKEAGSGIGLSLSRQIMHLHQGAIRVHSEKGVQTTFQLRFSKVSK